jgi:hypothetical protein
VHWSFFDTGKWNLLQYLTDESHLINTITKYQTPVRLNDQQKLLGFFVLLKKSFYICGMEWINAKDRLPEMVFDGVGSFSDYVLVRTNGPVPEVALLEQVDGITEWYFPANDETDNLNTVTHWCEIPKF